MAAALEELDTKLPGLVQYMEPDAPGMHTTPTVDIDLVLSGEIILELDHGATTTTLRSGDVVVQNGRRHRWRNEGSTAATLAYFIGGAHHEKF